MKTFSSLARLRHRLVPVIRWAFALSLICACTKMQSLLPNGEPPAGDTATVAVTPPAVAESTPQQPPVVAPPAQTPAPMPPVMFTAPAPPPPAPTTQAPTVEAAGLAPVPPVPPVTHQQPRVQVSTEPRSAPDIEETSQDNDEEGETAPESEPDAPEETVQQGFLPGKPTDGATGTPQIFYDDKDIASLLRAIDNQLEVMRNADRQRPVPLGNRSVTPQKLRDTLIAFRKLVAKKLSPEEFSKRLLQQFEILEMGNGNDKEILFTGYYTPVIHASRFQTGEFQYPLYYLPENMLKVELINRQPLTENRLFHSLYQARNFTREEIDREKALANQNLEIAWLKSEMDRYFLHIQGSGVLKYINGAVEMVQFMGSNGYPYQSMGRKMINDGAITASQGSMQGIKQFFQNYPDKLSNYIFFNKRYIFFRLTDDLPRGSSGAEVVGHRSIATDKKIYPAGGLAFIQTKRPILNEEHKIVRWEPYSRFVVDQDTGNAIRGPGRADLYFGIGDEAGEAAGRYMSRGKIHYLLLK